MLRSLRRLSPPGRSAVMAATSRRDVEIVGVGPRDGYQGIGPFIPTEMKIAFIERLVAPGIPGIEIGSFPQILVPSERRGKDAVAAGARRLVFVLSVSEAHNRNNVRRHPNESAEEYVRLVAALPAKTGMRLDIA